MMAAETILIIDNDPSHFKLEKLALAGYDHDIRTAVNAEETMKVLEKFQPRLICRFRLQPLLNAI